jgi:type VI secretion system protein ImpF
MANPRIEHIVQQGLLDRLIDLEPENRSEPAMSRAESLRRLRQSVKRDLEWLLNTTRASISSEPLSIEVEKSLLCYGLPDVASMSIQNGNDHRRLLRSLETAIETFEPRLKHVHVTSSEPFQRGRQSITFHVEAVLMLDPAPERISFDTVLEISKGAYDVKEA